MLNIVLALTALAGAAEEGELKSVGEIMEAAPESVWVMPDPEDVVYFNLGHGRIVVQLSDELAPAHVAQMKTLVREGFYDGLNFYRVIEGFVAQGGDQSEEKAKGSAAETLTAEFEEPAPSGLPFVPLGYLDGYADEAGFVDGMPAGRAPEDGTVWLAHCAGAFAFARGVEKDTASTEFYITLQPQRYLDRNLTVAGKVIHGMEVVQAITRGEFQNSGVIEDKSRWTPIISARLAADLPEAERVPLQVMDTNTDTFRDLIKARANRAGDFFYYRANHIDLCQMPVPTRMVPEAANE